MALRMRMNETYEELVHLKREHTAMQVKLRSQTEEVVLMRSDRTFSPSSSRCFLLVAFLWADRLVMMGSESCQP